jgi:hypothetical protein
MTHASLIFPSVTTSQLASGQVRRMATDTPKSLVEGAALLRDEARYILELRGRMQGANDADKQRGDNRPFRACNGWGGSCHHMPDRYSRALRSTRRETPFQAPLADGSLDE